MSDTPETDAQNERNFYSRGTVPVMFARKLERERDEARKEAERWRDAFKGGMSMQIKSPSKVFPWDQPTTDQ